MPAAQAFESRPPVLAVEGTRAVALAASRARLGVGQDEAMGGAEQQRRQRLATDPRALEEYYEELGPLVLAYLRRRVPPQDAEDVLQQVFLDLWRSRSSYDPARPMVPWVLGIAHKRSVDHLRRQARSDVQAVAHVTDSAKQDAAQFADLFADAELVRDALGALPEEQREALVLGYFADLTQTQIAKRLGVPLGTVKARSYRGLRKLAAALVPEDQP
jgi:RNA polymerase sigma factor (sigma-70 family)